MLSRRQIILLAIFVSSWILVGAGLAGSAIPGMPRSVASAVGLTGVVGIAFFIPGALLYSMLCSDPVPSARSHALAIKWRWRLGLGGGWALLLGASLLIASTQFRIAGAIAAAWGLLCLSVIGLSLRRLR